MTPSFPPTPTSSSSSSFSTQPIFPHFPTTETATNGNTPQTLTLTQETLFSSCFPSFTVHLAGDTQQHSLILRIQPHHRLGRLHTRSHILDAHTGALVCSIVQQDLTHVLHTTFSVLDAQGGERVRVRRSNVGICSTDVTATIMATCEEKDGKARDVVLQSNFLQTRTQVVDENGLVLARIERKFFSGRVIFSRLTYTVQVAPGVDLVLIAALCVCLDEMNKSGKS